MNTKGKLIVIEGLDGSGKATQSALLADWLRSEGRDALQITFPDYDSPSSGLVKMYLAGEIGGIGDVNAYAASSFYAADRYISYQNKWRKQYQTGQTIIADRYTTSNAYHQMAKLDKADWDGYLDWLWDFEFTRMGLPPPDTVIYLDMPPEASRRLLEKRYGDDGGGRDIHENDLDYMLRCRKAALYAAKKLGWHVLDCCENQEPLPIEEVAKLIRTIINGEKDYTIR